MTTVPQAFKIALQHHQGGRLAEAEAWYLQILAVQPEHADALHHLGIIAQQVGRHDRAVELIQRAIGLAPRNAPAHSNLGEAYRALGKMDDALVYYRRALQLQPNFPEVENNLGLVLVELGRFDEAVSAYSRAMALLPNDARTHNNLGTAFVRGGRAEEGIASYRRALELDPHSAEVWNNLGNALKDRGRPEEALVAFHRALQLAPNLADAHYNLANALRDVGRFDEATTAYRQAVALQPEHFEAQTNLGNTLKDLGLLDEALAAYRRARQLRPADAGAATNLIYLCHFHPGIDEDTLAREQAAWNRQFGRPEPRLPENQANDRNPERRLRVGYVSPDFRDHVVGRNLVPLFRHQDREQFEIVCYSGVVQPDRMTEDFRRRADLWRDVLGVPDEALAEMVRQDGVDLLVDLTQHMAGNRLTMFAHQPAPVQVSFAGYPASAGVEAIGYRISDRHLESHRRPAEQVFLTDSFWCYDPGGMEVAVNPLPALEKGWVTFGSLNNFCKINEEVLKLWARVLGQVPDSRLVLLSPQGSHRQRAWEFLEREGVAASRVEFVERCSRKEYLEMYHRLDVVLDPFPYGGHTTSLDALWMGVPVVSLAGERSVSRAGLSQLTNLGLREWVAFSEDDYVGIARRLAGDLPRLADWRRTLRPRMETSVLMDGPHFAQNIETAFRAMWRRWCAESTGGEV